MHTFQSCVGFLLYVGVTLPGALGASNRYLVPLVGRVQCICGLYYVVDVTPALL